MEKLYNTRCLKKATKISRDPTHPGSEHFVLLRSGKRFRTMDARTNRLISLPQVHTGVERCQHLTSYFHAHAHNMWQLLGNCAIPYEPSIYLSIHLYYYIQYLFIFLRTCAIFVFSRH
ncbi:unnamed protein product [Boreogadus saida]